MSSQRTTWRETYPIHSYEIGPGGRVRMQSICNYLQDAAGMHARKLGVSVDQLLPQGLTWVLSKLRVKILRFPVWGESVSIETWPAATHRLHAIRDFELFDHNQQQIGVATSAWLMIDAQRKRPVRLPADVQKFHPDEPIRALEMDMGKIPSVEKIDIENCFEARFSDLDLNHHVNNVSYIEWVLETVPEKFEEKLQIDGLEIEYLAESLLGDSVIGQTQISEERNGVLLHRLMNAKDNSELVRARSVWKAKKQMI